MQLQQDELSLPGPLAGAAAPRPEAGRRTEAREAVERLLAWDFVLDKDSVPAAIYVAWEKALKAAVWELVVPARGPRGLPGPLRCRPRS